MATIKDIEIQGFANKLQALAQDYIDGPNFQKLPPLEKAVYLNSFMDVFFFNVAKAMFIGEVMGAKFSTDSIAIRVNGYMDKFRESLLKQTEELPAVPPKVTLNS